MVVKNKDLKYLSKSLNKKNNILFFYGIEFLEEKDLLVDWLNKDEENIIVFIIFNDQERKIVLDSFSFYLKIHAINLEKDVMMIKELFYENFDSNFELLATEEKRRSKEYFDIKSALYDLFYAVEVFSAYKLESCNIYYPNFFKNLNNLEKLSLLNDSSSLSDVPCIICGSGESLIKNLSNIAKVKDKALIISTGTSLEILLKNNIRPDLFIAIDPNYNLPDYLGEKIDIPIFFQIQINTEFLKKFSSKKILLPSKELFQIEKDIFQQINIDQDFKEYGNLAGIVATVLAFKLNIKKLVTAGMDFCHKKKRKLKKDFLEAKNISNEKVYSKKDWLIGKSFLENFLKENKYFFSSLSNEGLFINNVNFENFTAIEERLFKDSLNKNEIMENLFSSLKEVLIDKSIFLELIKNLQNSVEFCNKFSINTLQKINEIKDIEKIKEIDFSSIEKEIFYKDFLSSLWPIFFKIMKNKLSSDIKKYGKKIVVLINKLIFFENFSSNFLKTFKEISK